MGDNGMKKIGVLEIGPFGLEEMLDMDMSQSEIARWEGVERQAINQRLIGRWGTRGKPGRRRGMYDRWLRREQEKIGEARALNEERSRIARFVQLGAYREARSYAELKALDYWYARKRLVPFEKILALLEDYFRCRSEGTKKSYENMGRKAGIYADSARAIIISVGGKSLNFEIKGKKRAPKENGERAKRAIAMFDRLSYEDIGYLCGVATVTARQIAKRMGIKRNKDKNSYYYGIKIGGIRNGVSVRRLEEFYDAADAGFNREECLQYAGLSDRHYDVLIRKREEVEGRIREIRERMG